MHFCIHTVAEMMKFYAPAAKITVIALAGIYIHAAPVVETGRIKDLVGDASKKGPMFILFSYLLLK